MTRLLRPAALAVFLATLAVGFSGAQDKSVRPGINDPFKDPDVAKYVNTFEVESREIYAEREKIVAACGLKPGMFVADVGAGTGLFTRLFAPKVAPGGKVIAVDIAQKFLDHIAKSCKEAGIANVETRLCKAESVELPAASIDVAFICDTYHHFEFPYRTMTSVHAALKPGGRVVLVDFHRIPGKSREWVLGHVRAGQDVVIKEIESCSFKLAGEEKGILQENYILLFDKVEPRK
jgi:ubiquinone/menaquinone biosynthesis C-methylase UbiE